MAFLTLTFFADMSTGREVTKRIKKITITLILYGLLIEIVQWQLPYRSFSIADLAADLFAISSYWALAFVAPIFSKDFINSTSGHVVFEALLSKHTVTIQIAFKFEQNKAKNVRL